MPRARLRRFFRHGFLPQLLAFEATVRHGSVTRAAEELCLAQSSVSTLLAKLSETLGGPVTHMRDRRVEASAIGREALALCREVMRALDRYEERQGARYDAGAAAAIPETPCPSPFPRRDSSRWRQRASQCPRARRMPATRVGGW